MRSFVADNDGKLFAGGIGVVVAAADEGVVAFDVGGDVCGTERDC